VPEIPEADAPVGAIVAELRALRALPEELRALPVSALDPSEKIDRRAAERLARIHRDQLRSRGESERERAARERERPWTPSERWTLRKRLWRERRDHERDLIDTRDETLAAQERALAVQRDTYARWLDELAGLDPQQAAWCAELRAGLADEPPLAADIAALWRRRREAAQHAAARLRDQPALRAALPAQPKGAAFAARALWPALRELERQGALPSPLTPLLAAALVAELLRR
jgi:hypothetical protein